MKRSTILAVVLTLVAPFAAASDFRHLRFASTPTQAALPGPVNRADTPAPYALTGRAGDAKVVAPSAYATNAWVVGNPHFRPGK